MQNLRRSNNNVAFGASTNIRSPRNNDHHRNSKMNLRKSLPVMLPSRHKINNTAEYLHNNPVASVTKDILLEK